MEHPARKITKIAREAEHIVLLAMRQDDIGTAEIDCIHALRHHPGITQTELAGMLHADKPAIARRTASLEAEGLRNAKAETESAFYDYLMDGLSESDRETFLNLLDVVYRRSKAESRAGFPHLKDVLKGKTNEPKA